MEEPEKYNAKLPPQIVGNVGQFYVGWQLSLCGLNVMPTTRNLAGIDMVAHALPARGFAGIQVKTRSKRNAVALGATLENVIGEFWIIVTYAGPGMIPIAYIMTAKEVRDSARETDSGFWLEMEGYEKSQYRNNWQRIVNAAEDQKNEALWIRM